MPIELKSLFELSSIKPNSLHINHLLKQSVEVNKTHNALVKEFKKTFKAILTQLKPVNDRTPVNIRGTAFTILRFEGYRTKSSPASTVPINILLSAADVLQLRLRINAIEKKFLKVKNPHVVVLRLIYMGKKGSKYIFEAEKGEGLLLSNITNYIADLNSLLVDCKSRIYGAGKAPKVDNDSQAAQEIQTAQASETTNSLLTSFESIHVQLSSLVTSEVLKDSEQIRRILLPFEMSLKKLKRLKTRIDESTDITTDQQESIGTIYSDWLLKFKKAKLLGKSDPPASLQQLTERIEVLERGVEKAKQKVGALSEILDLMATCQEIRVTTPYKALLKNNRLLLQRFKAARIAINYLLLENATLYEAMEEAINSPETLIDELEQKVDQWINDFSNQSNNAMSFQQLDGTYFPQLLKQVKAFQKQVEAKAKGMLEAAEVFKIGNSLDISQRMTAVRSKLVHLKRQINTKMAAIKKQVRDMAGTEMAFYESSTLEDKGLYLEAIKPLIEAYLEELAQPITI